MVSIHKIGIIFSIYILLFTTVILAVISGVSFHSFSNSMLIFHPKFELRIFFGCGIGISILIFISLFIFLFFPTIKYNYIITFPLLILLPAFYVYFSFPSSAERYISHWDGDWKKNLLLAESFQIQQKCCGWINYSDHPIDPCPIEFKSGCRDIVLEYLSPTFSELFVSSLTSMVLAILSVVLVTVLVYIIPDHDILRQIDVASIL